MIGESNVAVDPAVGGYGVGQLAVPVFCALPEREPDASQECRDDRDHVASTFSLYLHFTRRRDAGAPPTSPSTVIAISQPTGRVQCKQTHSGDVARMRATASRRFSSDSSFPRVASSFTARLWSVSG